MQKKVFNTIFRISTVILFSFIPIAIENKSIDTKEDKIVRPIATQMQTKEVDNFKIKLHTLTLNDRVEYLAAPPNEDKSNQTSTPTLEVTIEPTQVPTVTPTLETKVESVTKEPVKKVENFKEEELRYMSAIIFAEAGNQCIAGQQAVGIVVMERVRCKEYFKDDVKSVIYEPKQFTPASNGQLNKALKKYDNGKLPKSCIEAAKYALQGNTIVKYNGKEYDLKGYLFFGRYIKNKRLVIQDHHFK